MANIILALSLAYLSGCILVLLYHVRLFKRQRDQAYKDAKHYLSLLKKKG